MRPALEHVYGEQTPSARNYFHEWIYYKFLISQCRGDWDPDRCTFWVLTNRKQLRNGDFREKKRVSPAGKIGHWHCAVVLFSQVPHKCTHLDLSLLYIQFLILGTYSKFARGNSVRARCLLATDMLERWLQVCRVKITSTVLLTNCFVSTTKNSMQCVVSWIPLRISVRLGFRDRYLSPPLFFLQWWNPI